MNTVYFQLTGYNDVINVTREPYYYILA